MLKGWVASVLLAPDHVFLGSRRREPTLDALADKIEISNVA